jgi:hypothetical protein
MSDKDQARLYASRPQDFKQQNNSAGEGIGSILAGYIAPGQLARELGVSERTLARWHAARLGPPRVTIGRRPYYRLTSVAEWIALREEKPPERRGRRARP